MLAVKVQSDRRHLNFGDAEPEKIGCCFQRVRFAF
jgi:hypothetical protein